MKVGIFGGGTAAAVVCEMDRGGCVAAKNECGVDTGGCVDVRVAQ